MMLRFDESTRLRLRRALLRKGRSIAEALAEVLAGKGARLRMADLPTLASKPGMRPEEKLRAYLDHVDGCRALIDADDDRYGRCGRCGDDLGLVALEQMPWADRCMACAGELG